METTTTRLTPDTLQLLPHTPGIYFFYNQQNLILYIGKAVDLSRRVHQYFNRSDAIGPKTAQLVSKITTIGVIETSTEFDALLLEARMIGKYKPKYNSIAKDDKSPLYIGFTMSEELPAILSVRGRQLPDIQKKKADVIVGPFQHGYIAKSILGRIRHSIPFCTQKARNGRPCFYTHLGLCNPCPSVITPLPHDAQRKESVRVYRRNIIRIKDIFLGKTPSVIKSLQKDMRTEARALHFEKATLLKQHIAALHALYRYRYDVSVYLNEDSGREHIAADALAALQKTLIRYYPSLPSLSRIECIDISTIQGHWATGSLVVLTDGLIDTSQYRRFRIRSASRPNDVAMIEEVMRRRFSHSEWKEPDLLVIDGGKPQVSRATEVLKNLGPLIPIIGLSKRREDIVIVSKGSFHSIRLPLTHPGLQILQAIRDEAHRFAKRYHVLVRKKSFV